MSKKNTTVKALVTAYNEAAEQLGRKPVKSFKSAAVAEQRVKAILKDLAAGGKAGKAAKAKREPREKNPLSFLDKAINIPRKDSLPGLVLAAVTAKGGAPMEALEKLVTRHDEERDQEPTGQYMRVVRCLRHMHYYNSLQLKMDGKRIVGTLS